MEKEILDKFTAIEKKIDLIIQVLRIVHPSISFVYTENDSKVECIDSNSIIGEHRLAEILEYYEQEENRV